MWFVASIFLVLWILSIEFYMPVGVVIALFAVAIGSAAVALMPRRDEVIESDHE